MAEYLPGREAIQPTAAPNLTTTRASTDNSANALLAALGSEDTQRQLAAFNKGREEDKLREQQVKFDWYVEQFQKDHGSGAVNEAQIKSRFPETVPVIAARVAEAIGHQSAQKQFRSVIEEVAGNDSLRLDTTARNAFLKQKRDEILAQAGNGNDFYGAGMVGGIDKLTAQYEQQWAGETAQYHQKVQGEQFSAAVVEGLNSKDPHAALMDLDGKFGKSSSLSPLERNKIVVNSAIDLAFAGDDPKVLDRIPGRFLNVDSKAALEKARIQVQGNRMTNWRFAKELERDRLETEERNGRTEIVQAAAAGNPANPADYRHNPKLYEYALSLREMPSVPEAVSAAAVQSTETRIWANASNGSALTMKQYQDEILANRDINPKDKGPLIARLEKLVEGTQVMKDDLVRQAYTDRVNPAIHALENSPAFGVYMAQGRNIRGEVVKGFDLDLRRLWQSHFEETGEYPRGSVKQTLIDKALDRAELRITGLMDLKSLQPASGAPSKPAKSPAVVNNPATAAPTQAAPKPLRQGVTVLN